MSNRLSDLHSHLLRLGESISESINQTPGNTQESSDVSTREALLSMLPDKNSEEDPEIEEQRIHASIKDFVLACALISSSRSSTHELLSWIPERLSVISESAFREISKDYVRVFGEKNAKRISEFGIESESVSQDKRLVMELMPEVLPALKDRIKESSINKGAEDDEISAASSRTPVGFAILAAYQLRWFVTQTEQPYLGRLCNLMIPCGLTALDHWSPEVKGQGMISFIHFGKNVNAAEFQWYEDVILDACCRNIASGDEIWLYVVQMSVLFVTKTQKSNPRSPWFEKILNETLSHLERQPRNKERRIAWLNHIEPLFHAVGLTLLVHFRRIFPLFFLWMHMDDETLLLVLKRVQTVTRITWIRNSPYITKLVDELVLLHKEAALSKARETIRTQILQTLKLLKQCKGSQFEAAWDNHRGDQNLSGLNKSLLDARTVIP